MSAPAAIETERLLLRPFEPDDAAAAFRVLEGHPDTWRFDPGHARTPAERTEELQFRALQAERQGWGCLAVTRRRDGALLGYAGLQLFVLEQQPFASVEVELFYKLGREHWGYGYATEACTAQIAYAFDNLQLPRLVSVTHRLNERSTALLARLGFRIEPAPPAWTEFVLGVLDHPERRTQGSSSVP